MTTYFLVAAALSGLVCVQAQQLAFIDGTRGPQQQQPFNFDFSGLFQQIPNWSLNGQEPSAMAVPGQGNQWLSILQRLGLQQQQQPQQPQPVPTPAPVPVPAPIQVIRVPAPAPAPVRAVAAPVVFVGPTLQDFNQITRCGGVMIDSRSRPYEACCNAEVYDQRHYSCSGGNIIPRIEWE